MIRYLLSLFLVIASVNWAVAQQGYRTWTSKNGKFRVEAKLIRNQDGQLTLEKRDGQQITVALDQLSSDDNRFLTAGQETEDERSGTKRTTGIVSAAKTVQLLSEDTWTVQPDSFVGPISAREPIDLPTKPMFDANMLVSPDRTMMVIAQGGRGRGSTVLRVFDLFNAQPLGDAVSIAPCFPIGISPDKRQLLAVNHKGTAGRPIDLLYVIETGGDINVRAQWKPYGRFGNIAAAYFIDDDHVLTVNQRGDLGLWDVGKIKLLWKMQIWPGSLPGLSPNRKQLFVHSPDKLVAVDSLTGDVLSQVPSNGAGIRAMSVNDSGTRLVGAGSGIARVWDLTTGQKTMDFAISAVMRGPSNIIWLNDDQILINTPTASYELVDLNLRCSLWCYFSMISLAPGLNGEVRLVSRSTHVSTPSQLIAPALPHGEAKQLAASFATQRKIAIPPGSTLNMKVVVAPEYDRKKEVKDLRKVFTDAGYKLVKDGGIANFEAILRSPEELGTGDDKLPLVELVLMNGPEVIWRASRDPSLRTADNHWSGYIIPKMFRLLKVNLDNSVLAANGEFEKVELNRSYADGHYREQSGTGGGPDERRKGRPPRRGPMRGRPGR